MESVGEKWKFKVSPSFWVLTLIMLLLRQSFLFGAYIVCVLIHEFAHFACARMYGYRPTEVCLSAFGAVLYGDFEGIHLKDEVAIAIVGPCSNLIFAILIVSSWWVFPQSYTLLEPFLWANLSIAFVNLLPCFPLDGGRVVVAFLSEKTSFSLALNVVRKLGVCFAFLFSILFIWSLFVSTNLTAGLFAVFLMTGSLTAKEKNCFKKILFSFSTSRRLRRGVEVKKVIFSQDCCVRDLLALKNKSKLFDVLVVDEKMRRTKLICFDQVDEILQTNDFSTKLKYV